MGRKKKNQQQPKRQQRSEIVHTPQRHVSMHEESTPVSSFYAAIVNETDFHMSGTCPICETEGGTFHNLKEIEEDSGSLMNLLVGDIVACNTCGCVVISIAYPIMDLPEPVYLDWEVFKAVKPEEGNTDGAIFTVVTSGANN